MTLPKLLDYARRNHADKLGVIPVLPNTRTEWMRRASVRRPASIEVAVPDDLVVKLRGPKRDRPLAVLLLIPREVADEAESPIVRPSLVLP